MKLKHFLTASYLLLPLSCIAAEPFSLMTEKKAHVVANNRILANVNGKAISVIDLMKKMDVLFYREFPEYASNPQARFQFYSVNWKHVLTELIDKELIVADADEAKLPLSAGDIRQEMEHIFGPNIIENLDKIGMSFDEAQEIVKGDLIIQRMIYVRVNSKAMRNITPSDIRKLYDEHVKKNMLPAEWTYRVITIRNSDKSAGAETANAVYSALVEENTAITDVEAKIKASSTSPKDSQITLTEEFKHKEKEISPSYKDSLLLLTPNSYSKPVAQTSRADKSTVFRIYYLKEFLPERTPPYKELEGKLKNQLLEKEVISESTAYLKRLRKHFDVQENIPENFQPFELVFDGTL